jgi:hypothetical protein
MGSSAPKAVTRSASAEQLKLAESRHSARPWVSVQGESERGIGLG